MDDESGSVSMESVMDTVTRVFANVSFLGATYYLIQSTYAGINSNIWTLDNAGSGVIGKTVAYINRGSP